MVCPSCGEENPERARFCLNCGAALGEAPIPAGEERKVVSVLFVDLVGFTAASEVADPEDVRARLRPYHSMLKREIERFGGTVEKFIGDAVMAVFGAPIAHEDDADRAVRAALRITEAIPELNEDHPGLDLQVRAAVNTGEAVVALGALPERGEGIVTGDVVNTAARLQGEAPIGGVVVGEITHRTTRDTVVYQELEPVTVKGKAAPVALWRAMAARSRYGVDVERPRTPFVGRENDLALLQQAYVRTLRESSVQLVTIVGEPGVGKTRLVAEFQRFVDDRPEIVFWRQGRCLPYGDGITFWPLGEVVKAQAGVLESDDPEEAGRKLAEAVDVVAEDKDREWLRSRLAPLVGAGAEGEGRAEREESSAAWRAFLESVAAVRPLVMIVEDLHWADDAMRKFIEDLVDWSTGVPLVIVCTARPELYEREAGWGGGKRNSSTISLSPLSGQDTARLIAALLDQAVLPAETQELLIERAGGNPLYTEEFVRMLVDRGILERRGQAWTVASDAEIPVPDSVQALIAARLDTLPGQRKALLQDASVVGKVFWSGAVAGMSQLDETVVRAGLHELSRKELVRTARRSSMEEQTEYSFWHLLIRDVAYAQIPRAARAAKHRAAAEWIERMAGERVADHAEMLAHHYLEALELARVTGTDLDPEDLRTATIRFLMLAGERARALDLEKAASYYQRALALSAPGSLERARALGKVGSTAWYLWRFEEGIRSCEEAISLFEVHGDEEGRLETTLTLATLLWNRGETQRSRALTRELIATLEQRPPSRLLAAAYVRAAGDEMLSGNSQGSLEFARKGLPLAREFNLPDEEGRALQFRGIARAELGDLGGLEDLRAALAMALEKSLALTAVAYVNLANWVWETEGPEQALELYREAIQHAERRGALGAAAWAWAECTWVLYELGRWDEVVEIANRAVEEDLEESQITSLVLPSKAQVLAWRGRFEEAAEVAADMLPRARRIGDPQVLFPALSVASWIEARRGNTQAATLLAREFAERTEDRLGWRPYSLPDLMRGLIDIGETDLARSLVDDESSSGARGENYRRTCRAILADVDAQVEAALALHAENSVAWGTFGFDLERGQALLGAGRCLAQLGRAEEAATQLREARAVFVGLQATPLVAEADGWLARATAVSS